MKSPALSSTDTLIRLSRRSLWAAFFLVAVIGANGMLQLAAPASQAAHTLALLLPVAIVISAASLGASLRPHKARMAVVHGDELRQFAVARAHRNALLAVLTVQPLLAVGLTWTGALHAVPMMAIATALTGALVAIGSVLYVDR
jgi:hypothetical protein